ncbi:MAG: sugar phosphate nucleotidyltransferase [Nitrospirota bacterium]
MEKINAFVLAAGIGERLRPITDHSPKPLLTILGKPLIATVLERVCSLPVDQIGVNLHYKGEMIYEWIQTSKYTDKIRCYFEDLILGTGGALKNAESMLSESYFLVHNSDIFSNINLTALVEKHQSSGNIATLAVHDHEKLNNVWIDKYGYVNHVGSKQPSEPSRLCKIAFTGIAVYSPEFLKLLPKGNSSVVDTWVKAVSEGHKIGTEDFTGCQWFDIGTPEAYSSLIFQTLHRNGETIHVHPSVDCGKAEFEGYSVLEQGCTVEGAAQIKNTIALSGAKIKDGSRLENVIIGPDYTIKLGDSISIPGIMLNRMAASDLYIPLICDSFGKGYQEIEINLIGTGGSDRKYFRVRNKGRSAVLMECARIDPDYHRHIIYTQFFRKYSVPVPELLNSDNKKMLALFEDLGDVSLYSWLKCKRPQEKIENLYKLVLDILVNLHTTVTKNVSECHLLESRVFDYDHLRWETDYFVERFVCGVKDFNIKNRRGLADEFDRLARKTDSFRKSIVHRDFQSQNIMVLKGDSPRLLDYQGARIGPPAYDVASILLDPYFRLEDDMRDRLLNYYVENMKDSPDNTFDESEFRRSLLPCRLQRHMQALGAYGFLAKEKGKTYFLKHIPRALQYLKEGLEAVHDEYPFLNEIVRKINEETCL